jgi:two-component system nitrate/nitrite sensor histidine kinase NarQ
VSRLAAELHDRIAQLLWSTDVDIALALDSLPPNAEEAREHLLASRRTIDVAYRDVRLCIGALRANLPFQRDALDALDSCLADFRSRTGISAAFTSNCPTPQWSRFVQLNVLAIVQQGLDNVARHAQATRVDVELDPVPAGWSLTLRDNGRGFPSSSFKDHDPVGHYGLAIMRERADSFGGSFAIYSARGEGTTLTIGIPDSATPRS